MGYYFSEADHAEKSRVWWNGGSEIEGLDSTVWREDRYGSVMKFQDHGDRDSKHGWEIDHIMPTARGGGNELSNLQPLHWANNVAKGDKYPY